MTRIRRTGRSSVPVTAQDGPAAAVIAERSPRWVAMITTIILAVLPGLEVTQHAPAVLSRGHVPVALAYLAAAAAVSIWGCWRGWRMGLRLDDHGVTVRNFFHSHQFGWHEVSRFADGSVHGGEAGRLCPGPQQTPRRLHLGRGGPDRDGIRTAQDLWCRGAAQAFPEDRSGGSGGGPDRRRSGQCRRRQH
jgi:hypothetical protein